MKYARLNVEKTVEQIYLSYSPIAVIIYIGFRYESCKLIFQTLFERWKAKGF